MWSALSPGRIGYERFPYLIHALTDLGVEPPFRGSRLWAFFDYSYRTRVDVDYFARHWRESGISALHVAAWHFYDPDEERDAYLRRLIAACHREGVMVYGHGDSEYTMRPGDTLLLDGEGLHGPHDLVRLPIRFLAVTAYPDSHD